MTPEKWLKIEKLFHTALEIDADKRLQFIETQADDKEIFAEVVKLISAHEESKSFIQNPVAENAFKILSDEKDKTILTETHKFSAGEKIGRFEVIELIGKGGMGEVFLARDHSLERDVAIKILPTDFTSDSSKINRFIREAKAVSALNHPNILTIHEIGEIDGVQFMAAEYVNGQTLTNYLKQNNLTLNEVLEISIQIVSALQAAHETGIIHRDIKPDNLMVRNDGILKVLDFGLAKLIEKPTLNQSNSQNSKSTMAGMILGTPNYMSPEQARGKDIDFQTDIFSFGIVLYEMLTGKLPFHGETVNDTIAQILTKEPEIIGQIPAELIEIVGKSLQKDKKTRYQNAKSLLQELKEVKEILHIKDHLDKSSVPNISEQTTKYSKIKTTEQSPQIITQTTIKNNIRSYKSIILVSLAILIISFFGYFGYKSFNSPKQIESIAVLPFTNENGDSEIDYLSDGMAETLIKSLSNIPNLNVKSRTSVFRYKGKSTDLKKIAEELNVQAVVTGRIVQRGDEITLSLDLVEPETEKNLWNERYIRKQSDLVILQNEIARDVSTHLKLKISGMDNTKVLYSGTMNPEAFQLYLKGLYILNSGSAERHPENVKYFEKAVELDPNFALGYVGIADSYTLLGTLMRSKMSPIETMPKAKAAAEKAIQLNPNLSEAYTSLGWIKFRFDWDWAETERNFKKAIELDPTNARAHQWYGEFLSSMRRHDEAIREMTIARDLEPFTALIQWNLGKNLFIAGRFDEALPELKKALELDKNLWRTYRFLFRIYKLKGMESEAFEAMTKESEVANGLTESERQTIQEVYKQQGFKAAIKKYATIRLEKANLDNLSTFNKALIYLEAEDSQTALDYLEKAYSEKSGAMVGIYNEQLVFKPVQNEPRFKELLRKMNFPQ